MQVGPHHPVEVLVARVGLGFERGGQADLVLVAAGVGAVPGVHRLVRVAHQVHEELERVAPRFARLRAVGEDRALFFDGGDHAIPARAIAGLVEIAAAAFCVDVVPARGELEARRILIAQRVGPVGDAGQGRIRFAGQQFAHLRLGGGREMAFGDGADQAVPERAPGQRRRARGRQCGEKQQENGDSAHRGVGFVRGNR